MNEVVKTWQEIKDVEMERDLFNSYTKCRSEYLTGLKKHATGKLEKGLLICLYEAERVAFEKYLEYRTSIK